MHTPHLYDKKYPRFVFWAGSLQILGKLLFSAILAIYNCVVIFHDQSRGLENVSRYHV